jgi:phospho-N-acetylmuramoyl-pentapeptide-transferase
MLYQFFYWLTQGQPYAYDDPLFRAGVAVLLGFLVVWLLGPRVIMTLVRLKIGDQANFGHELLNEKTRAKKNTPTMGGILIVFAIFIVTLLLADLSNFYVRMGLFCVGWLAVLGGIDDYLKLTAARRGGSRDGLHLWEKLVFQIALGALLAVFVYKTGVSIAQEDRFQDIAKDFSPFNVLSIPFYKGVAPYYGIVIAFPIFWIITVVVITGTSNAVNLTDGMDGLASGCMIMTAVVFLALAIVVGNADVAKYLLFFHVRGADELAVMCGAVIGACLAFLWYNGYPAQVFMGDTGSLPLGGLIGYIAIVTRLELMLFIVGGIFVIEALSVLIQIFYFKWTGGQRFFRCAPLHHHYHLGGWSETQVVMRFWLVAALFAVFALATIKLR